MHLVFCSRYFSQGGGSTGQYVYEMVDGLLAADPALSITVLTSDQVYRGRENESDGGTRKDRLGVQRLRPPQFTGGRLASRLLNDAMFTVAVLLRLLSTRDPDLFVVYSSPFLLPAGVRLASMVRQVPFAYVLHDIYPEFLVASGVAGVNSVFVRILRRSQRRWLSAATAVVVLGRCMARTVATRYGVDPHRLHVIPHWPNPAHVAGPLARHDQSSRAVTILYGGNLGFAQDLETVLRAANTAQTTGLPVRFSFAVSGSHVSAWNDAASNQGLQNVEFRPAVPSDEYVTLVEASDISLIVLRAGFAGLAVPSKLYSLLEAGKPIVAVMEADSETAMVIEEHRCGYRIDPGDDQGLFSAIAALVEDPGLRHEMGERARRAAHDDYPLSMAVERFRLMVHEAASA